MFDTAQNVENQPCEVSNSSFQRVNLPDYGGTSDGNGSKKTSNRNDGHLDENGNRNSEEIYDPQQFGRYIKTSNQPDELGFCMSVNQPLSHSRFELAEVQARVYAFLQDKQNFELTTCESIWLSLVSCACSIAFIIYYIFFFLLYITILSYTKKRNKTWSEMLRLGTVNAVLNFVAKIFHRRMAYYLTKWQVPKYQSEFDRWYARKLILSFMIEYSYFFYMPAFGEFYFTTPERLKTAPLFLRPCFEG